MDHAGAADFWLFYRIFGVIASSAGAQLVEEGLHDSWDQPLPAAACNCSQ